MSLSKWQKLSDRITVKVVSMTGVTVRDETAGALVVPEASDPSPIATA
jgi:hypothetical protein